MITYSTTTPAIQPARSHQRRLAWITTEITVSGKPVVDGGSLFTLAPAHKLLTCAEQATRVLRRRRVNLDDLVLTEVTSAGLLRNHWKSTVRA